jgi:uncharacterized protein (DUF58 family)
MTRSELLKKINTFPFFATKLSSSLSSGMFRSTFRGQGIEFEEVRQYQSGDNVGLIDKNVSARYGKPFVKLYREERQNTTFIIFDCSASMFSASLGALSRHEQAVLTLALFGFSAEKLSSHVGAVFYDNTNKKIFFPEHGKQHVLALVSAALALESGGTQSNIAGAISGALALLKRRSLVIIISDFMVPLQTEQLAALNRKHSCLAVHITDPIDSNFPKLGAINMKDVESGRAIRAASNSAAFSEAWTAWNNAQRALVQSQCIHSGAAYLNLSTEDDAAIKLPAFFRTGMKK